MLTRWESLPYLTDDLPGCGGSLKTTIDDFFVEELPQYDPCGEGTHHYLTIEKRGITTLEAVRRLARALHRRPGDIGYAGMKDARGVTRQTLSVEHVAPERFDGLQLSGISVLRVARHTNKLRVGHLAGNRFVIRLRGCCCDADARAEAIAAVLVRRGVPNYFGPQRFGRRGCNAQIGQAVLRGDFVDAFSWLLGRPQAGDDDAERSARELYDNGSLVECAGAWPAHCRDEARLARRLLASGAPGPGVWRSVDRRLRTLYYSALQSALFNRVLAGRMANFDRLTDGDIAWKHANGACFVVEEAATEQARCDAFEISPTGPIIGARMTPATGAAAELESDLLGDIGIAHLARRTADGIRLDGARRPLRVAVGDCQVSGGSDAQGAFLQLSFRLARGSYATSLTREFTRS